MVASVFFALPAVLASEVGHTGETVEQKRRASDSLTYPVPGTLPLSFSSAMIFCQDVTDNCTLARSADAPLFIFALTTPLHRCLGSLGGRAMEFVNGHESFFGRSVIVVLSQSLMPASSSRGRPL